MFFTNEIQKIEINSLDDLFLDLEEYKKIKEKNLLEFKIQKIQENILNKINNKSFDKIDLIFPENNTKDLVELISDDYNELALKETEFIVNDELSDEVNESDSSINDYYGKSGERKDVKVINNVNEECLVSDDCEINLKEFQKENSLFTKKNKK